MRTVFSKDDTLAMKGIAIIMLFFHHCFMAEKRFANYDVTFYPLPEHIAVALSYFCKICVGMFVFLSAYGMTVSFQKKYPDYAFARKEAEYLTVRRYLTLMLGYIFCVLVSIVSSAILKPELLSIYGGGFKGIWTLVLDVLGLSVLFKAETLVGTWWYMGLAITLIFAMPLLLWLYKKFGFVLIGMAALIPTALSLPANNYWRYLLGAVLGIVFADQNLLVRLADWRVCKNAVCSKLMKLMAGLLLCACCVGLRHMEGADSFYFLFDSLMPVVFIAFFNEFIIPIKGLRFVLIRIGRYSMNMFLLHTLIRVKFFPDFTYSFHSAWLILLVLLLDSWLVAAATEGLKKITGYQKLTRFILAKWDGYAG